VHPLDFPLWLRALHFCNLLFATLLIRSGLEILSAHPKLYWNDNCLPGTECVNFGRGIPDDRRLAPTPHFGRASAIAAIGSERLLLGVLATALLSILYLLLLMFVIPRRVPARELLWTSRDEEISLPSWLALPGKKNLGMGRHWHFLCDAGWLLTVETQLGFMMVKYIQSIEFIADCRTIGQGQGGWREDYQFYSPEAGI
jgi:methionine sulfoxide reductase catalytic subunit